jgi:hypothetical protein
MTPPIQLGISVGITGLQVPDNEGNGGESGIRTHACSMASITCRNYIATDAKFPTLAAHHCTLLHAGGKIFCSQHSLRQRAIAFELTVPITTRV